MRAHVPSSTTRRRIDNGVTRRTKIVATLGPACDDAGRARGAAAGRRRRRAPQPQPRPARRAPRRLARGARRSPPTSAGRSACSPTCPGPKIRAGAFPEGGVDLVAGQRRPPRAGHRAEHGRRDLGRLPDAARRRRAPATGSSSATAAISLRVVGGRRRPRVARRGRERRAHAGPARRAPAVRAAADVAPRPTQDLELAEAVAAAGVEFIALSFVRRAADVRRAARGRRRPGRHRRQDRDRRRRSATWPRSPTSPTR